MASPTSVLSKTLQSITLSKIRELESRRKSYENHKREHLDKVDAASDARDRLSLLLGAVKALYPPAVNDTNLDNIRRWLDQSRYDASVPVSKLDEFSGQLRAKLDIQSRKLDMAHLYSRLLTEWMDQPVVESQSAATDDVDGDSFELVAERQRQRLSELVDKFESVVFQPLETDESEMHRFIDRTLPSEEDQKRLKSLREKVGTAGADFMHETTPFTKESLTSCIKGLLTEDILSDEKQAILRDFLDNDIAKSEIADVLNMRFSDLKHWQWDAGEEGIRVMPRRGLNGKYRVWADDDILQMIFVQHIGIRLCNMIKPLLKDFMDTMYSRDRDGNIEPGQADRDRYAFFSGSIIQNSVSNVRSQRVSDYFDKFFLSQLPTTETSLFDGDNNYDDDDDNSTTSSYDGRGGGEDATASPQKRSGIKQQLLRQLTAELAVHQLRGITYDNKTQPGGAVALVQTDLQWFATGLPHSTVFAAMRYLGFGEDWIAFFKTYLESPLNLDRASDDRPQLGPRIRKRGVPMAHSSEKLTGEIVLFLLDFVVNRQTGIFLYRLHDDIWLVGEPSRAAQAWDCMQSFARVFGLDFNRAKTGSVYLPGASPRNLSIVNILPAGPVRIGFLCLDPKTGKWGIDQKLVMAHVDQLKTQLAESKSVLSWVQTWNSCMGRFFSHTFGEPAHCFGREHVNDVLDTYQSILDRLFPVSDGKETGVVEYVKQMIQDRFGVSNLPDAFIHLPEQLGGLGLRNPFVGLFLVRNNITQSPKDILDEFLDDERTRYLAAKAFFEKTSKADLSERLSRIIRRSTGVSPDQTVIDAYTGEFFSLEEYSRFRESTSGAFMVTFNKLIVVPDREEIALSKEVESALRAFLSADSVRLDAEKKWFLQLYAKDLLADFDGLNLVDKQFLPVGVLAMMRGKKVSWNMVI
ncbi:uncharacterized protein C8A04DRAFT_36961 [Dichotomopilus funicola]|uniref:Reverse transcriptase n=1 Tax=Dichotomopilus funicola TaxID=1934379 RepID=A0AAN6V3H1_9PEZI|nr:hypothetical protein C8A04DRAFT_36961 [Dichotomopilus funicola]